MADSPALNIGLLAQQALRYGVAFVGQRVLETRRTAILQQHGLHDEDEETVDAVEVREIDPGGGCPACTAHDHVAAAGGKLRDAAKRAASNGGVVPPVGCIELDVCRAKLQQARDTLGSMKERVPSWSMRVDEVVVLVDQALVAVPASTYATEAGVRRALDAVANAEERSGDLAYDFNQPDADRNRARRDGLRMRQWYSDVTHDAPGVEPWDVAGPKLRRMLDGDE